MRKTVRIIYIALMVILVSGKAYAGVSVEPYLGKLKGYTLYRIGGTDYDPLYGPFTWGSELEWPVASYVGGVELGIIWDDTQIFGLSLKTNLDKDSGAMIDSDYENGYRYIYSETDLEMEMYDVDANIRFGGSERIQFLAGFRYQDFSFEGRDTVQVAYDYYVDIINGLTITYDVTYKIPYVGVSIKPGMGVKKKFYLSAKFGYVMVEDEDDHVLRDKLSKGEATGYSLNLAWTFVYNFSPDLFMKIFWEHMKIVAEGEQDQVFYAGPLQGLEYNDIDFEIESSQTLLTFGLGYRFF